MTTIITKDLMDRVMVKYVGDLNDEQNKEVEQMVLAIKESQNTSQYAETILHRIRRGASTPAGMALVSFAFGVMIGIGMAEEDILQGMVK